MIDLLAATLLCSGVANTNPVTKIEVEVKPARENVSTFRYEIAEGPLAGTAYIQSIGYMHGLRTGEVFTFRSGQGPNATVLTFRAHGSEISESRLTHYISGMDRAAVVCAVF